MKERIPLKSKFAKYDKLLQFLNLLLSCSGTADDTEDTKFIDMNSFLDVSCDVAVKLEAEIDNESRA